MTGFDDSERAEALRLLRWGLDEDLGAAGDITSTATLPPDLRGAATMTPRHAGVVAGLPALPLLAELHGGGVRVELLRGDGPVAAGEPVARFSGPCRALLTIERTGLNFVCHLSGIATLTAQYVAAARGTKAKICDTRKILPGWRRLAKYAVRRGGGTNHRIGLFDAILIKDNHLAALAQRDSRPIAAAISRARAAVPPGTVVQCEVDCLAQLEEALAARPDMVLLDNMDNATLRAAVLRRDAAAPGVILEASGGVTLSTIAGIAATGVERISVGALTHSAPALDLGLDEESPG